MADQGRRLNIPIYDTGFAPEGAAADPDMIDVEVIDKVPRPSDRARARQGARTQRDGRQRAQAAQAAEAKRSRTARANLKREAKTDPLAQLKLDTVEAGEAYMLSLRQSGILDAKETKVTQRKQLSGMHQVYASMMVLQCVQPLQQGINGQAVASVLGMGASMWMLSPNFRAQLGTFVGQMGDVIRERIASRGTKKDDKARSKFESLAQQGNADRLAGRWQKRLDKIEHAERGHRLPFTAHSAAMTEVALAETAYADMRRPGADPRLVQDRYESALSALYEYVDADGLNREDVSRTMRIIVGQRLEKDPAITNVFTELGHGRFVKSEPREVYINGTTDRATVWTGDYIDSYEGRTIAKGSFRLRPQVGVSEHRLLAAETLSAEMVSARSVGELNDVLSQYVVASSVGQYPDAVDQVESPEARTRMGKARTMFASMAADGLSPAERHFAYSAAYVDAVEVVQRLNPELGNKWVAQYGDQWREKVAESMKLYSDLGAQAERAKHGSPEPATHTSQPTTGQRFTATADGSVDDAQNPREEYAYSTEDIVDAEVVGDEESTEASDSIVDGMRSTSKKSDYDQNTEGNSTAARFRRARVNQHYNEVDTGGITGIGRDDAAPLQDVDFQLG